MKRKKKMNVKLNPRKQGKQGTNRENKTKAFKTMRINVDISNHYKCE